MALPFFSKFLKSLSGHRRTSQRGRPRSRPRRPLVVERLEDRLGPALTVLSLAPAASGFAVQFNRAVETSVLNLYDAENGGLRPADATLVGTTSGSVQGSLVADASGARITFVRTGGALEADTYTVVLRSAADGFRDTSGSLLDGNSDGTPGDHFTGTFTVAPTTAVLVSAPDFARAPGQPVNVPASSSTGIPLRLSQGAGVTSVALTVRYDPALLQITGASTPVAGANVTLNTATPGAAILNFTSAALPAGAADFVRLAAQVPAAAPYRASGVLDLTGIQVNGGAILARDDDGVQVAALLGDATGNAAYSTVDAQRTLRLAVSLDSGFSAYPLIDPEVIADINGNGRVDSPDATRILQEAIGIDRSEIPPLPPRITAALVNDTAPGGVTNADGITSDPRVAGTVTSAGTVVQFRAGFDNTPASGFLNVLADLQPNGAFSFTQARINQINGAPLADGSHTLHLLARDQLGNERQFALAFTFDTQGPTLLLDSPVAGGKLSSRARLAGTVVDPNGGDSVRSSLDGGATITVTAGAGGRFEGDLAAAAVADGPHQAVLTAFDRAGNSRQTTVNFTVSSADFTIGPASSSGWGAQTADAIRLDEENSFLVQTFLPVTLGQPSGTRTLRFEVLPQFDSADTTSVSQDRFLVYLVNPSNPSQTLLDSFGPGTALFSLTGSGAEYRPGLVRYDGGFVEIDLTSVTTPTTGRLIFQLLNGDSDTGTAVQVRGLTNTTATTGASAPTLPLRPNYVAAGPVLNLAGLTASATVKLVVSNVRFDPATGRYTADLRVRNDGPSAIGRQVAVVFPGLPAGVTLQNPSGTDPSGAPYLNFQPASPPGGLERSRLSDPIAATFNDPTLLRFALTPTILVGMGNRAPVLPAVSPLSVMPGGHIEVALNATDPDGDTLTYDLRSTGTLPSGMLRADGTLIFTPAPGQTGTYTFTVAASDGILEAMRPVTLMVVADPVTTTRISGVLLNTNQQPLAGVPIELGPLQTTTAANGSFTVSFTGALPSDTIKVHAEAILGNYPFIAEPVALLLGHDVYPNVDNVISRPIFLPQLNSGMPVNPAVTTTISRVLRTGEAATQVVVAAHSLLTPLGAEYNGHVSITEEPVDLTPAALPANLVPDLVVTIQPAEMTFLTPAPLTFPNRSGWAPGTLMNLWSINPSTGFFDDVGDMVVSADGQRIITTAGGIRNSSWHFGAPRPVGTPDEPGVPSQGCPGCECGIAPLTSSVDLQEGSIIETHTLAPYLSLGLARTLTLTYDSLRADSRPIFQFGYNNVSDPDGSALMYARLYVRRGTFTVEVPGGPMGNDLRGGENFFNVQNGSNDAALQVDLRNAPSGKYLYFLDVGLGRFVPQPGGGSTFSGSSVPFSGVFVQVNARDSSFGAGWGLAGLQELIVDVQDGSVILLDGNGADLIFNPFAGGLYTSPSGDFSTLERLGDGTFRRTLTDGTVELFNAQNKLGTVRDRNGNETRYFYDASGRLLRIIDPANLETVFGYTAGRVTSITDPAGRKTQLEYDSAGNLMRVVDPDGSSRRWAYDADHHLVAETDQRGNRETVVYGAHGRVVHATRADGSRIQVDPVETRALYPTNQTSSPVGSPPIGALAANEARYADGNGNVIVYTLDSRGQIASARDATGPLPTVQRDRRNLVTVQHDARGHLMLYTYDSRGNLMTAWDDTLLNIPSDSGSPLVNGAIAGAGEEDVYAFTLLADARLYFDSRTSNGNLNWTLRGPTGTVVNARSFAASDASTNADPVLRLVPGGYTLTVAGTSDAVGPYQFRLFNLASAVPISLDTSISGALSPANETDLYRFEAPAGERFFFDVTTPGSAGGILRLIDPFGGVVFSTNFLGDMDVTTLPATGVYTLLVEGNVTVTSITSYTLNVRRVVDTPPQPLVLGTTTAGFITEPGEQDRYTFTLATAAVLYFDAHSTIGSWTLTGPSGTVVSNQPFIFSDGDLTNDPLLRVAPGAYTLTIDTSGDVTSAYVFRLLDLAAAAPLTPGGALPVVGDLTPIFETDLYRFNAAAGDRFVFDVVARSGGGLTRWGVVDPYGNIIYRDGLGDIPTLTLTRPGTYTLMLEGSIRDPDPAGFMTYAFQVQPMGNVPPPPLPGGTALSLGATVSDAISTAGELDHYRFTLAADSRLYFDSLTNNSSLHWTLEGRPVGLMVSQRSFTASEGTSILNPALSLPAGDYLLTVAGSGSATGAYSFRLYDLAQAQPITPGTPFSSMLDPGNETDLYRFTVQAGDRFFFDNVTVSGGGIGSWRVIDPHGGVAARNPGFGGVDLDVTTLAVAGISTLLLEGPVSATGAAAYTFNVQPVVDVAPQALSLGSTINGTLPSAGRQDRYTFTLPAASRLYFDALTNNAGFRWTLQGPPGTPVSNRLFTNSDAIDGVDPTLRLPAGNYTLTVDGVGDATGAYSFRLSDLGLAQPLTPGTPVMATLSPANETDLYRFSAQAGDRFYFDLTIMTGPTNGRLRLLDPFGGVFFSTIFLDMDVTTLPVTGTYTLLVEGAVFATGTASYTINVQPVMDAAPQALVLGSPVSGTLPSAGRQDRYTFTLPAASRLYFDSLTNNPSFRWTLQGPPGTLVNARPFTASDSFGITDPALRLPAGDCTLTVDGVGDITGAHSFRLSDFAQAQPLTPGTPVMGTLSPANETDLYRFTAQAGDRFLFDVQSATGMSGASWRLIDPFSNVIFHFSFVDVSTLTLPRAGVYTLLVEGQVSSTGTGAYTFNVDPMGNVSIPPLPDGAPLMLGSTVTDSIGVAGEQDNYRFTLAADSRLYFDALTNNVGIVWTLVGPAGTTVSQRSFTISDSTDIANPTLNLVAGDYLLTVAGAGSATGAYSFRLNDGGAAIPLTPGMAVSATLSPANETDLYRFSASAGDRFFFDVVTQSGVTGILRLIDPYGGVVFSTSGFFDQDVTTLPAAGVYTLLAEGSRFATGTATYTLNVQPVVDPAPLALTLGSTVNGAIAFAGEQDRYTFTLPSATLLYFDALTNSANLHWTLAGPAGTAVNQRSFSFSDSSDIANPVLDLVAGSYTLTVDGSGDATGAYSFRLNDGAAATLLTPGTPVSATLSPANETDLYRFSASAGDRFFFDVVTQSGVTGILRLIDPYGGVVFSTIVFADVSTTTLPAAGTYTLLIEGFRSATGSASYSLNVQPAVQTLAPTLDLSANGGASVFTYDPTFSQLTSITDGRGRLTLFDIDPANGNVRSMTQVVGALGGPDDLVTMYTYTPQGLTDTVTDPLGRVTDYDYDSLGRLSVITFARGTIDQAVRRLEYDPATVAGRAGLVTAEIDENGNRTEFRYDVLNRLTRTIEADPDGAGPLTAPVTLFAYDVAGNLETMTDARGNITRYQYDNRDRLTQMTDANQQTSRYSYDPAGNLASVTDELGHTTRYVYDARNRPIEMIDPDGGRTLTLYDPDNNAIAMIDPLGNRTSFLYDGRDRIIQETDPLGRSTQYTYDAEDNMVRMIDRNLRRIDYAYDDLDRLITETWVGTSQVVRYSYDKADNLLSVTDAFSTLTFTYDNRDRVKTVDNVGTPGVPRVVLTYTYDGVGNVLSVADTVNGQPGATSSYRYDALHRVDRITQSGAGVGPKRLDLSLNELGRFTSLRRYSNLAGTQLVVESTYQYDALNRLTALTHTNSTAAVAFYHFTYDSASRITQLADIDGVTNYTYDNRDELIGADHSNPANADESYAYDANGNRISSHRHGAGYQTGPNNRLLSDGTFNYMYDNEGNLIRRTEIATGKFREFSYDHRDRLVSVTDRNASGTRTQVVTFSYDALDRRIRTAVDTTPGDAVDAVVTHFVYDGDDVILDFVDSDGAGPGLPVLAQRYLLGPGIDQMLAQEDGAGNVRWLLTDHLGTVRDLVDNGGVVVNHIVYDSYGNVISQTSVTIRPRYLFTGRELDEATELYYYRARYYDATTGRFLAEDPIGLSGNDANIYRYVGNTPTAFVDPMGWEKDWRAEGLKRKLEKGGLSPQLQAKMAAQLALSNEIKAGRQASAALAESTKGGYSGLGEIDEVGGYRGLGEIQGGEMKEVPEYRITFRKQIKTVGEISPRGRYSPPARFKVPKLPGLPLPRPAPISTWRPIAAGALRALSVLGPLSIASLALDLADCDVAEGISAIARMANGRMSNKSADRAVREARRLGIHL